MKPFLFVHLKIILLLNIVTIISCTSSSTITSKNMSSELDNLNYKDNKILEEYKAEIEIGRNMAGRLLQFYGNYNDKKLLKYVNAVGAYVASQSDYPYRKFMIEILNSKEPNAFATPGGYIFITTGALMNIENEAELAAILAHEITHVGKKHIFNTLKAMNQEELNKQAKEIESDKNIPPALSVRQRPKGEKSEIGEAIAKYLAASSSGLNIIKAASAGMNLLLKKGLDPQKEFEADHFGVIYATNAGYNPYALKNYLCRIEMAKYNIKGPCDLKKISQYKSQNKIFPKKYFEKTHPPTIERLAKIELILNDIDAKHIIGAKGTNRYKSYIAKLKKQK